MQAVVRFKILVLALLGPLALAACGTPRVLEISRGATGEVAGKVEIFVATTREASAEPVYFNGERGPRLAFARLDFTVPPNHKPGELELPDSGPSDPSKHFAVTNVQRLDLAPIVADVRREIMRRPPSQRDVLVFVHGFNTNFADAAYRFAQIVHDSGFKGVPVLFTWPSRGQLLAYPYDRESAFYSRDFLELNLRAIARDLGPSRMDILAHSMGTLLTLETLRMLRAEAGEGAMARIGAVVLAAPDIDIDLFTSAIERMGPDVKKVTVISSTNDRALELSGAIAGGIVRAGAADRERLEALGVRVADASDYGGGLINHDLFLSNPEVQGVVKRAISRGAGGGS